MDMAKNQALFWIQIASTVAVLAGVLLVVIQLKQNEELLKELQELQEKINKEVTIEKSNKGERAGDSFFNRINSDMYKMRINLESGG